MGTPTTVEPMHAEQAMEFPYKHSTGETVGRFLAGLKEQKTIWGQRTSGQGVVVPPQPSPGLVAITVSSGSGDYRSGDEIWLDRLEPERFASALNRDILVPRPAGRFLFGRLIGREDNKLHILPLGAGGRQTVVTDPPWAAVAVRLIRSL